MTVPGIASWRIIIKNQDDNRYGAGRFGLDIMA
jgi:hypothetical protein